MNMFQKLTQNKFVFSLMLSGILILVFSILSGIFDQNGVGQIQLSLALVGATLALLGIGLTLGRQETDQVIPQSAWLVELLNLPNILWAALGFSIAYLIFLVAPMFFDPSGEVMYFKNYLYLLHNLGTDFTATLNAGRDWLTQGTAQIYYPPRTNILFAPLGLIAYPGNYYVITILTVISYFTFAGLLPSLIAGERGRSVTLFIFGISIFSYGLQFELERGQFHTIAMALCLAAIYIFHRHRSYRFFAYLLFCISVQLKVYPALLILLFVDDWRDWKTNLKRFAGLGLTNFLLLFLQGYSYFSNFMVHMLESTADPHQMWWGNHSITSFLSFLSHPDTHLLSASSHAWLQKNTGWMEYLFLVYVAVCFLLIWINAYRRNTHDIDSFLLMACILGVLIVPSINHDYTLPLLVAPFALLLSEPFTRNIPGRTVAVLLLIASTFAYTITLIPSSRKPLYLQNAFPALIILLTVTTILSFLRSKEEAALPAPT